MKEHSELERFKAVATQYEVEGALPATRTAFSFLSVFVVILAFAAGASPLENATVRLLAVYVVVITVLLYARWRYAPLLAWSLLPIMFPARIYFDPRSTSFDWVEAIIAIAVIVWTCIVVGRLAIAIRLAGSPECTEDREKVERWLARISATHREPGIVEFSGTTYGYNVRTTICLLRDDEWIVIAKSRRRLLYYPSLTVLDARVARVKYSREKKSLRIGDLNLRKVNLTPELEARLTQIFESQKVRV